MESAIQLLIVLVTLTSLLMTLGWVVGLFPERKRMLNFSIGLTIAITTISLICKFLVGLVSIAAIAIYGFKSSMFTFAFEHFLQISSIGISISIMLEGLALIFKRKLIN